VACSIQYPHSSEEADAIPKLGLLLEGEPAKFTALPPPKGLKGSGPAFHSSRTKRWMGHFFLCDKHKKITLIIRVGASLVTENGWNRPFPLYRCLPVGPDFGRL